VSWTPQNYTTYVSQSPPLLVFSSISYSEIAGRLLLAAKESHLKKADLLIAEAISHSLVRWLRSEWVDTLIPIPSRKSAVRKRGRQFIEEITQLVAASSGLAIAAPLRHSRQVRDQSGLKFEERRNNLDGALVVKGKPAGLGRVLLVDDLVTTGATLNEAARALRYAGIEVIGAVTAAIAQTVR
jgi:predicted amidophosphoribosyltransferase